MSNYIRQLKLFMAKTSLEQRRYQEAITQYRNTLSLSPENDPALSNLGTALSAFGQHHEALSELEKALKMGPKLAALWFDAANIIIDLGDFKKSPKLL